MPAKTMAAVARFRLFTETTIYSVSSKIASASRWRMPPACAGAKRRAVRDRNNRLRAARRNPYALVNESPGESASPEAIPPFVDLLQRAALGFRHESVREEERCNAH